MLDEIRIELQRLDANNVMVSIDVDFEPDVGELVKVQIQDAYWHLLPDRLLALLKELADDSGGEAIRTVIEQKGTLVWHGPSPKGSRDASS
jgi:hypothetical protein